MSLLTLNPTDEATGTGFALALRPSSLRGQTLGIVANGLGASGLFFDVLAEQLTKWDGLAATVKVVKPSVAVPPWPEQWEHITSSATVAVTGFGGCGSCSTRSMRDALDLEAAGIPAVCIVHTALVPAVRALARLAGVPNYPVVEVGYPLNPTAMWTPDEANRLADEVVDGVRSRLTT
jgi:hypothetical protein